MKRLSFCIGLYLLLSPLLANSSRATSVYDNTALWNGVSYFNTYGTAPGASTFGETFSTPDSVNTVLQDFDFYIRASGPGSIISTAYVFAFDDTQAVGQPIFTSSPFAISGTTFQPYTIHTGGLKLTAGTTYVAFFSVSNSSDYNASTPGLGSDWEIALYGPINDNHVAFDGNGNNFSLLTTSPWDFPNDQDSGFYAQHFVTTMDFSSVPTPMPAAFTGGTVLILALAGIQIGRRNWQSFTD